MGSRQRTRGWCFTLQVADGHGGTAGDAEAEARLAAFIESLPGWRVPVVYAVAGVEHAPSTGRVHLQGFLYFKNALRLQGVRMAAGQTLAGAHFEGAGGSPLQNREYCTKEGKFAEYGECPSQGKRTDLESIRADIEHCGGRFDERQFASEHFGVWLVHRRGLREYASLVRGVREHRTEVYWFYGECGTGKSRTAWESREKEAVYELFDHGGRWFDGYDGQPVVILDDLSRGELPVAVFLRLADRYPCRVQVKGGTVEFIGRRIYVTSQFHPCGAFDCSGEQMEAVLRRIDKLVHFVGEERVESSPYEDFEREGKPGLAKHIN